MPPRVAKLPRDHRGFPVPWFVTWFDETRRPCAPGTGTPDFRVVDPPKWVRAHREKRCWICGEPRGVHLAFLIGPMCVVNRTTSEPPAHRDCALYAAAACPFLSRPRMRRNEKDLPEHVEAAGIGLQRNPGAVALYTTRSYSTFRVPAGGDGNRGVLIQLGEPEKVEWFAEGRTATQAEVAASIDSGFPLLLEVAEKEGPAAVAELDRFMARARQYLPAS